jgi:protein SCO1/2
MSNATLPLHKIIVFIVFICAALMSSVFIYRASQKPVAPVLSEGVGFILPAPRDIKAFKLMTENNQAFTERNFYDHWTLLFFGFTHCSTICPTTLDVLNRVYDKLHLKHPSLQVTFFSIDPERDTPVSLAEYVHRYNANFIGATGEIATIRKLQSQLGIYAEREAAASENYQIQHTASILLINPQGKWAGVYQSGLSPTVLAQGIETAILSAG